MTLRSPLRPAARTREPARYSDDRHAWALTRRDALSRRGATALDRENLAEEIGDLGSSQCGEMESRLTTLHEHLLKHQFALVREPARSWKRTTVVQRGALARLLGRNPSRANLPGRAPRHAHH